jgi:hypothetical protein
MSHQTIKSETLIAGRGATQKNGQQPEGAGRSNHNMLKVVEKPAKGKAKTAYEIETEDRLAAQWLDAEVAKAQRGPTSQLVEITVPLARVMLQRNQHNRSVSQHFVKAYSRDIASGSWSLNGEPIILAKDGSLNDGQHRAEAIVMAGRSITVMLVIGVERDTRTTLDQGRVRTVGDYRDPLRPQPSPGGTRPAEGWRALPSCCHPVVECVAARRTAQSHPAPRRRTSAVGGLGAPRPPNREHRFRSDGRAIDAEAVAGLAESIAAVGLINPIRVRVSGDGWEVIAGAHRLSACKSLGLVDIAADVVEDDDLHAELAMIDENLCRWELSPAERARQTARRRIVYQELHPETKQGGNHKSGPIETESFTEQTAKATGRSEQTVYREAARGEKVIGEVIELIRGTSLDTGSYLDKLAKMPGNEQFQAATRDLAFAQSARPPRRALEGRGR